MTVVEFLTARLDEDERDALAASQGPWSPNAEGDEVLAVDGITVADGFALSGRQLRATVDHIVRHDPARVRAEIEAKRRIIAMYEDVERDLAQLPVSTAQPNQWAKAALGGTLLILALPYASHPDYREEWRP